MSPHASQFYYQHYKAYPLRQEIENTTNGWY